MSPRLPTTVCFSSELPAPTVVQLGFMLPPLFLYLPCRKGSSPLTTPHWRRRKRCGSSSGSPIDGLIGVPGTKIDFITVLYTRCCLHTSKCEAGGVQLKKYGESLTRERSRVPRAGNGGNVICATQRHKSEADKTGSSRHTSNSGPIIHITRAANRPESRGALHQYQSTEMLQPIQDHFNSPLGSGGRRSPSVAPGVECCTAR